MGNSKKTPVKREGNPSAERFPAPTVFRTRPGAFGDELKRFSPPLEWGGYNSVEPERTSKPGLLTKKGGTAEINLSSFK